MRLYTDTEIEKDRSKLAHGSKTIKQRNNWVWGMAATLCIVERTSEKFKGCIDSMRLFLNEDAQIKRIYSGENSTGVTIAYNDNSTTIHMSDSQAEELLEFLQAALA